MKRSKTLGKESYEKDMNLSGKYEVVLAGAEPGEGGKVRAGLYVAIGLILREYGKAALLPFEYGADFPLSHSQIWREISYRIVPDADLVLIDLGLESTAAGIIAENAFQADRPMIFFYERRRRGDIAAFLVRYSKEARVVDEIEFDTQEEAISRLRSSLGRFFSESGD